MNDIEMHGRQSSVPPAPAAPATRRTEIKGPRDSAGTSRVHAVIVPGFGGFDALGQLRYYPRTNDVAAEWRTEQLGSDIARNRLVLHYFDNLPTAGVNTRAHRLWRYLRDRIERNDFRDGDSIALVGHSTGGLDIRRLLQILLKLEPEGTAQTSSSEHVDEDIRLALLSKVKRVVFLSVPQRGTNIANWVRDLDPWPMFFVACLRRYFDALDLWGVEELETFLAREVLQRLRSSAGKDWGKRIPDVYSALMDVSAETSLRVSSDPVEAADGREALAEISQYLNQTDGDFLAIGDLAAQDPRLREGPSPLLRFVHLLGGRLRRAAGVDKTGVARASEEGRAREVQAWTDQGIRTLSFATFATPGISSDEQYNRAKSRGWNAFLGLVPRPSTKTDGTFRTVYRACQWGPFHAHARPKTGSNAPDVTGEGTLFAGSRDEKHYARLEDPNAPRNFIRSWENDGIVNTASMLWPNGRDTLLVQGDHADIIGHFETKSSAVPESGRKYAAYDIFGSDSGFTQQRFNQIWFKIFDFCLDALA